jgi:hypothetical protein
VRSRPGGSRNQLSSRLLLLLLPCPWEQPVECVRKAATFALERACDASEPSRRSSRGKTRFCAGMEFQ